MKSLSGIMSQTSQNQYLASCRARYPSRNRQGKSAMIDEVSDTLGWDRKHTIKALNGKVSHGKCALKRGSKRFAPQRKFRSSSRFGNAANCAFF
jgi:hypothetical protein